LNPDADPLHPFAPALAGEMVHFPDQRFAASSPKNTRHVLILLFHMRVNENTPKFVRHLSARLNAPPILIGLMRIVE